MPHPPIGVVVILSTLLAIAPAAAAEPRELTPDERAEIERLRPKVESVLHVLNNPDESMTSSQRFSWSVAELTALGPGVGPFLESELDAPSNNTFNIAAYVLGLVNSPGAAGALRTAYDVAEREGGGFGQARKQWAAYGLALVGDPAAVDLVNAGAEPVAWVEFMEEMRLQEVIAGLIGPPATPLLFDQLKRFDADESMAPRAEITMRALARVADRQAIDRLVPYLSHKRPKLRALAVRTLGRLGDSRDAPALLAALRDADAGVQVEAAQALYRIRPEGTVRPLLGALESIADNAVRGWIYRAMAVSAGEAAIEPLRAQAGRPDVIDRALLAAALGETGSRKALNAVRAFLTDRDTGVVLTAVQSLADIGGEGAVETLLALVKDPRWPVAQTAIDRLVGLGETRAAPRVADRLLLDVLSRKALGVDDRLEVRKMTQALVALRHAAPRDALRAAVPKQSDPEIARDLETAARQLDALATNGNDPAPWSKLLGSSDGALRVLAAQRLGEIGGATAIASLTGTFDPARPEEARLIVEALAASRAPEAASFLAKIVGDPAFDGPDARLLRAWAAWGLRRIGGAQAKSALEGSARRRQGQDWPVLLYLAQIAGRDAVGLLEVVRPLRLRHYTWERGVEQNELEDLVALLRGGQSIEALDRPPDRLHLHF